MKRFAQFHTLIFLRFYHSVALAGFLDLVSGNDAAARKYFKSAADADPSWALPHAHLSLMNLVENKIPSARKAAELALELEPNSAVAMISMAYLLKAELKLEAAYELTQAAVNRSPGFYPATLVSATIALEMEDYRQCRRLLDRLPDDPSIISERETLYGYLYFTQTLFAVESVMSIVSAPSGNASVQETPAPLCASFICLWQVHTSAKRVAFTAESA